MAKCYCRSAEPCGEAANKGLAVVFSQPVLRSEAITFIVSGVAYVRCLFKRKARFARR